MLCSFENGAIGSKIKPFDRPLGLFSVALLECGIVISTALWQKLSMTLFGMISTAKSYSYTVQALLSFFSVTKLRPEDSFHLLVNDGDWPLDSRLTEFPVQVFKNEQPLSFAANGNVLIRRALGQGADLVFLNNDLIFSDNWLEQMSEGDDAIVVPVSNNQFLHELSMPDKATFKLKMNMELADYLGNEAAFLEIARRHSEVSAELTSFLPVLCAPFFAARFPIRVLKGIGGFDLRYGIGGGEDYDYCLRAWLSGFRVVTARRSFLLHFGSKSIAIDSLEPAFINAFRQRWGERLTRYVFDDAPDPDLAQNFNLSDFLQQGFRNFIMAHLAHSPGDLYYPPG